MVELVDQRGRIPGNTHAKVPMVELVDQRGRIPRETDAEAKTDAELKTGAEVDTGAEAKTDAELKTDAEVKPDAEVKTAQLKTGAEVKVGEPPFSIAGGGHCSLTLFERLLPTDPCFLAFPCLDAERVQETFSKSSNSNSRSSFPAPSSYLVFSDSEE